MMNDSPVSDWKEFKMGAPVWLDLSGKDSKPRAGRVVGTGSTTNLSGRIYPVYLVELDEGFYAPEGDTYVRLLPVHSSALRTREKKTFHATTR